MGRGHAETFLQRRHTDGQEVFEKLLSITNCKENASQNISPHSCQNGSYQAVKCWRARGEKGILVHCW